jgi:hypothetical protein
LIQDRQIWRLLVGALFMSKDKAKAALDAARKLASQGKFKASLQKHIWFHNHALNVCESYYGIRLSFALADWMDLAGKYPPALSALKRIRDEKTKRLLAGKTDRSLFHDVESINERLNKPTATVDLFKRIDKTNERFATSIYDLADEAIIAAGEYTLARKHLGNPDRRFEIAQRNFEEGMQFAKTSPCKAASRRAFKTIFAGDLVRLITVLHNAGEPRAAKQLQSKALKVLNHRAIRNAIPRSNRTR